MRPNTVGRLLHSRSQAETDVDSSERTSRPPRYTNSSGLLKQPDNHELPSFLSLGVSTKATSALCIQELINPRQSRAPVVNFHEGPFQHMAANEKPG